MNFGKWHNLGRNLAPFSDPCNYPLFWGGVRGPIPRSYISGSAFKTCSSGDPGMLGIKSGLALCEARTLPFVLFLWPLPDPY